MAILKHYVAIATKFGDKSKNSYPIGVSTKKARAIKMADQEFDARGGKYSTKVYECPDHYMIHQFDDGFKRVHYRASTSLAMGHNS